MKIHEDCEVGEGNNPENSAVKGIKISLITVCFNSAKTLEQTLQSVKDQNYSNIEHLVIDGGSTDKTCDIIARYQQHISQYISEPDGGIYDAMNKGIKLATGDIIGFLNSDDIFANGHVLSKINRAFQNSNVEICYGDLTYFSPTHPDKIVRYWRSSSFRPGLFKWGWNPPHPTFYVRARNYARFGGFDTSFPMGNDVELMMRFLEKHRLLSTHIPEVLVKMRMGGVSNRKIAHIISQNKHILQAAKKLAIPVSPYTFILGKVVDRLSQFFAKTKSQKELTHA